MVTASTLLRDTIFFIKDDFRTNLTDPISRPANQQFIMTSYPQREVTYPIITIKDINTTSLRNLGLQSEAQLIEITLEIRCWGRNIKERDEMFEDVWDRLRLNQIGATGTSQANDLHDFKLLSAINVDEADGPKSKVIQIKFIFIAP